MSILTASFWEEEVKKLNKDFEIGFCPLEGIREKFDMLLEWEACGKPCRDGILVSSYSDYGLFLQKDFHPNKDIYKRTGHIQYDKIDKVTDQYVNISVCGIQDINRCKPSDTYSVKIDSLTTCTFSDIPKCIKKWFVGNCNVEHPAIEWIPLGMNEQGHGKDIVESYHRTDKKKLLYINCTDYTRERINLKAYYKEKFRREDWLTVTENRKIEDFYSDLADHVFVLCPFGNGLDSYRIIETLAVGSVPVLQDCAWSRNFLKYNLPIILIDNLYALDYNILRAISEKINSLPHLTLESIHKEFWAKKLYDACASLAQ